MKFVKPFTLIVLLPFLAIPSLNAQWWKPTLKKAGITGALISAGGLAYATYKLLKKGQPADIAKAEEKTDEKAEMLQHEIAQVEETVSSDDKQIAYEEEMLRIDEELLKCTEEEIALLEDEISLEEERVKILKTLTQIEQSTQAIETAPLIENTQHEEEFPESNTLLEELNRLANNQKEMTATL